MVKELNNTWVLICPLVLLSALSMGYLDFVLHPTVQIFALYYLVHSFSLFLTAHSKWPHNNQIMKHKNFIIISTRAIFFKQDAKVVFACQDVGMCKQVTHSIPRIQRLPISRAFLCTFLTEVTCYKVLMYISSPLLLDSSRHNPLHQTPDIVTVLGVQGTLQIYVDFAWYSRGKNTCRHRAQSL